jgi:hypothetical protein
MTSVFWICAIITAISAFVSFGFSLAALRGKGEPLIASMYASSRSIALALISLVPLFTGTRSWLLAIALAMVIVQALDALVGIKQHDAMKTFGPACLAILNAVFLGLLVSQ